MSWWEFALWGVAGGFVVDGLELWRRVQRARGNWPVAWTRTAFWVAECVRLAVGALVATALGLSGQVNGPMGAMVVGIAAPLLVEKMGAVRADMGA